MDIRDLIKAMKAAAPMVSTSRDQMKRIAVSRSRVRACDGYCAIHVWDAAGKDEDLGFVAYIDPRDIDVIDKIVRAQMPRVAVAKKTKPEPIPAGTDWAFDAYGINVAGTTYRLPYGTALGAACEFTETDKVIPKRIVTGDHSWTNPALVANVCRAFNAIGIKGIGRACTENLGPDIFVGESSEFRAIAMVMPRRESDSVKEFVRRRMDELSPPAPAKTPEQIEAERLRKEIAELNSRLAKVEGVAA